jgi:peptidyl-dipeptidase Dcp
LQRSSVEPFLQFSARRDLREKAFRAWIARGDTGGKTDNKQVIAETIALRIERAKLLGYQTFAHYRLDDAMAKTPDAVRNLLQTVWKPAKVSALKDRDEMQEIIREEGGNFKLAAWDWRYYSEKLRKRRCDFEESEVKPYLQLDRVIEAAFFGAQKLFGLTFTPVDVPVWHPDVRAWEVRGPDGQHVGLFYGDYYARPSKQGGAWMSTFRDQQKLEGNVRPLVLNVSNFNKGDPTLLSFEDARTLFHEMGHGLHGLLSNVTYPTVSCTSVLTDFVELPSQLYEHWFEQPEVLKKFARHHRTGEPMPDAMVEKLMAAKNFDRGCQTLEYISSALVDLDLHLLQSADGLDVNAFEKKALDQLGMPEEIVMRHRPPHHGHVFSGGYYASAYYSYMWSEVLDADAFAAFEETGDIFNPEVAKKLQQHVLSAGGSRDPAELYVAFRGRLPTADALLKKRGFLGELSPAMGTVS